MGVVESGVDNNKGTKCVHAKEFLDEIYGCCTHILVNNRLYIQDFIHSELNTGHLCHVYVTGNPRWKPQKCDMFCSILTYLCEFRLYFYGSIRHSVSPQYGIRRCRDSPFAYNIHIVSVCRIPHSPPVHSDNTDL